MTIFFIVLVLILTLLLSVSIFVIHRSLLTIELIEEQIRSSSLILDISQQRINSILELPVMSDDQFVRQVLSDITAARDSIELVKTKIGVFITDEDVVEGANLGSNNE